MLVEAWVFCCRVSLVAHYCLVEALEGELASEVAGVSLEEGLASAGAVPLGLAV